MVKPAKIRRVGTLLATTSLLLLSFAGATSAGEPDGSVVLNGQVQFGDVLADQELVVPEATGGVVSATTAVGNAVGAAVTHQNLSFDSSQQTFGQVGASSYVQTQGTSGELFVNQTSATSNTADASTCCGYLDGNSRQMVGGSGSTTSHAYSAAGRSVTDASGSSTAIGNSQGWAAVNGSVGARTVQENYGATTATNQAVFCCITGSGSFVVTATGNNVTSNVENGEARHVINQITTGETRATNDVYVVTGNNVTGVATASANNIHLYNTGGYAQVDSVQSNNNHVDAQSTVVLDNWYGTGSSIAYGVGNSLHLANVSPDPGIYTDQQNNGNVTGYASFSGGDGGGAGEDVFASATAVGNAVSGYACSECYGRIDAVNRQENNGTVRASARITAGGTSGYVTGTATAIGNSASYESHGGRP